mmetsp:Transcript_13313/g.34021  ORF Transcript_13313/g.34021 Transcript_13313/m.34021 type:complete len:327 (-) Transcript_13313:4994-5974(-)
MPPSPALSSKVVPLPSAQRSGKFAERSSIPQKAGARTRLKLSCSSSPTVVRLIVSDLTKKLPIGKTFRSATSDSMSSQWATVFASQTSTTSTVTRPHISAGCPTLTAASSAIAFASQHQTRVMLATRAMLASPALMAHQVSLEQLAPWEPPELMALMVHQAIPGLMALQAHKATQVETVLMAPQGRWVTWATKVFQVTTVHMALRGSPARTARMPWTGSRGSLVLSAVRVTTPQTELPATRVTQVRPVRTATTDVSVRLVPLVRQATKALPVPRAPRGSLDPLGTRDPSALLVAPGPTEFRVQLVTMARRANQGHGVFRVRPALLE